MTYHLVSPPTFLLDSIPGVVAVVVIVVAVVVAVAVDGRCSCDNKGIGIRGTDA